MSPSPQPGPGKNQCLCLWHLEHIFLLRNEVTKPPQGTTTPASTSRDTSQPTPSLRLALPLHTPYEARWTVWVHRHAAL